MTHKWKFKSIISLSGLTNIKPKKRKVVRKNKRRGKVDQTPNPMVATRALCFMDAYRKGLNGNQAAWVNKKYRGHRIIPDSILEELRRQIFTNLIFHENQHHGPCIPHIIVHFIMFEIHLWVFLMSTQPTEGRRSRRIARVTVVSHARDVYQSALSLPYQDSKVKSQ